MEVQILPPAMQHTEEAEGHAQALGIGGNGEQGLGRGPEQNLIDGLFAGEGDGGDRLGQSEYHVEVFGGQQFGLPLFQPLGARQSLALGTVASPDGDPGQER